MTTGLAWNLSNPLKPWAYFDADAIRDIPVSWVDWLADIQADYVSHIVETESPLLCTASIESDGVVTVRIHVDGVIPPGPKRKYKFTVHVTASDGQKDDQTLYLRLVDK